MAPPVEECRGGGSGWAVTGGSCVALLSSIVVLALGLRPPPPHLPSGAGPHSGRPEGHRKETPRAARTLQNALMRTRPRQEWPTFHSVTSKVSLQSNFHLSALTSEVARSRRGQQQDLQGSLLLFLGIFFSPPPLQQERPGLPTGRTQKMPCTRPKRAKKCHRNFKKCHITAIPNF